MAVKSVTYLALLPEDPYRTPRHRFEQLTPTLSQSVYIYHRWIPIQALLILSVSLDVFLVNSAIWRFIGVYSVGRWVSLVSRAQQP